MVAGHPRLDTGHRRIVECHLTLIDEPAADRTIRMPVLVTVAQTHHAAVFETYAARALHLQEECVHRVVHPEQFRARKQMAAGDLAPARVGYDALPLQLASQAEV